MYMEDKLYSGVECLFIFMEFSRGFLCCLCSDLCHIFSVMICIAYGFGQYTACISIIVGILTFIAYLDKWLFWKQKVL